MKLRSDWNEAASAANALIGVQDTDINLQELFKITKQGHLPQAEILQGAFERLKEQGLLEEAYLRGSFGRGRGDIYSDVDLFVVVCPENLEKVYDVVGAYLAEKGGIVTSCYDRLVADYGGIGFMFVANNAERSQFYQFDLYMAIKGVAPSSAFTIKPRIYARDPDYCWMKEYGNLRDLEALPEETKAFMRRHMTGDDTADRMELLMQEMMLNLFVANKHIKRGQMSRTVTDNGWIVASAVEFLQTLSGYKSMGYTSGYLGDEVARFCRENGDEEMVVAARRLERLFTQKMDRQKLRDVFVYCRDVLQQSYPDRYERLKDAIAFFEKEVLAEAPKPANQNRRAPKHGHGA